MGTYVMHGSWAMCFMPVEVVYHTRKTSEVLEVIERKHLIFFFFLRMKLVSEVVFFDVTMDNNGHHPSRCLLFPTTMSHY